MFPRFATLRRLSLLTLGPVALSVGFSGCSSGDDLSSDFKSVDERDMREAHRAEFIRRSKDKVVVVVLKDNRTWLNGSRITPKNLPGKLAELGRRYPGMPVLYACQPGTNPDAASFVERHAREAGLGPVDHFN